MVSPWELYETIFGRLYSGRDIPIVFSKVLVDAIRRSFEETDLCITSALHRYVLYIEIYIDSYLTIYIIFYVMLIAYICSLSTCYTYCLSVYCFSILTSLSVYCRFELCLVRHFEQPLSLLAMYKETAFLQQVRSDYCTLVSCY